MLVFIAQFSHLRDEQKMSTTKRAVGGHLLTGGRMDAERYRRMGPGHSRQFRKGTRWVADLFESPRPETAVLVRPDSSEPPRRWRMMARLRRQIMKRCVSGMVTIGVLGVLAAQLPTAEADAPPGRYTLSIDTVIDNDTGLEWQRVVSGSSYNWIDAGAYCTGLALSGAGWRLPTIQELQSIVDESRVSPADDTGAFPGTPLYHFCTSSVYAGDPGYAWDVDFDDGSVINNSKSNTRRVRCVR